MISPLHTFEGNSFVSLLCRRDVFTQYAKVRAVFWYRMYGIRIIIGRYLCNE